jgi:hypothetical protein
MEFTNNKIIKKFINHEETHSILEWVNSLKHNHNCDNNHIKEIRKNLNGNSYMFDISKTLLTNKITSFQSGNDVIDNELPQIFLDLIDRISDDISIPKDNVFLQILDMEKGGKINPHYDTAINGYITYKCNVSVISHDYTLNVDKEIFDIQQSDLYCFEASLFKHWTEKEFNSKRILLSYGFILPYADLCRTEDDYRVRLSKRIEKYFQ